MCDSIKFTTEEQHAASLALLNMLVTRTPEGSQQITVFRKPTHTGRYTYVFPPTIHFNKNLAFPELFSPKLRT